MTCISDGKREMMLIKVRELEFLPDHLYEEANYVAHGLIDLSMELYAFFWNPSNIKCREFLRDMPYGVAKARTGDPHEWICNKLTRLLGDDND
jgi:hypothetical protein